MRGRSIKVDRRKYVLVPKAEYQKWRKWSERAEGGVTRNRGRTLPIERYPDRRVAEFPLSNTTDAADYARVCKLVKKLGLNPETIDHDKPVGVE
jgi:hypothetical protein